MFQKDPTDVSSKKSTVYQFQSSLNVHNLVSHEMARKFHQKVALKRQILRKLGYSEIFLRMLETAKSLSFEAPTEYQGISLGVF